MDRGGALLQQLRQKLVTWQDRIKKSTSASDVHITAQPSGEFIVVVTWLTKEGVAQHFERRFTKQFAFGGTYTLNPMAWAVEHKVCDYARSIIHDVLQQRGIL